MRNNQDTRYKQVPNSKFQIPKLFIRIWSWVIISLLVVGYLSLAVPARALENPEEEIAKVIEDYVITKYPEWIGYEIRITFKYADKIFESLRELDENADFEVVEVYKDFKPIGNVIFPMQVTSDEISRKIFVRAKVEVFKEIVVAEKRIDRGESIGEEDVALEERDIAMLPEKYFENLNQVLDTEAKTTIPKKSTIFEWMIKEIPLVHRGEEIAILVTAPNLLVKTEGVLLEDGYLGKKAKVKRKGSKATLEGILISSKEIEVKLK